MRTIAVDDERWMLKRFEAVTEGLSDIQLVGTFRNPLDALEFAKDNTVELAFLDVSMPEMDGLTLAEELRKIQPQIVIIFVSAYDDYMIEAFKRTKADYYILKPYEETDIEEAVERARLLSGRLKKSVSARTFGTFELFVDDAPVPFPDELSKEIMALLVDKHGGALTEPEACEALFGKDAQSEGSKSLYEDSVTGLRKTLEAVGQGTLLRSNEQGLFLPAGSIDTDLDKFLNGDSRAVRQYHGDYMEGYAWADSHREDLSRQQVLLSGYDDAQLRNKLVASIRFLDDDPLTMTSINDGFVKLTGYSLEELDKHFSNSLRALIFRDDFNNLDLSAIEDSDEQAKEEVTFRIKRKDGELSWVICTKEPSTSSDDEGPREMSCVLVDISEIKSEQSDLERAATHDGLTGLLNRTAAQEQIEEYMSKQAGNHVDALILMDVDKFKDVNDTYGHPFADTVLSDIGAIMTRSIRSSDIACRLGGDEMMLFLKGVLDEDHARMKLEDVSKAISERLRRKTDKGELSCSFGGTIYPTEGKTFSELYQNADKALYAAKQNRGSIVWHSEI